MQPSIFTATPSKQMSNTKLADVVDKSFDYVIVGGGVRRSNLPLHCDAEIH